MSKNIVWLASYPKSGNTWLRVFLTNFLRNGHEPADINELEAAPIASASEIFDELCCWESEELSCELVDRLRPEVYRMLAREQTETLYCKCHDAYTFTDQNEPLLPPEATNAAIYLVRNPLDVCVSFAHHSNISIAEMVEGVQNTEYCLAKYRRHHKSQLRQKLLTWAGHVESWMRVEGFPVHIVRYEDMVQNTEPTFASIVRFLGLDGCRHRLGKAITFARFNELQQQEDEKAFKEKLLGSGAFFRKGSVGSWREELTQTQADVLCVAFSTTMHKLGYLNNEGKPVY